MTLCSMTSSTTALGDHHLVIVVLVGDDVVFVQVQNRDGLELGRYAAGARDVLRVRCVYKRLDDGVFGGRQVGSDWDVALPHTLERLQVEDSCLSTSRPASRECRIRAHLNSIFKS